MIWFHALRVVLFDIEGGKMEIKAVSSTFTTLAKAQSTTEDTAVSKESSSATQKPGGTPMPGTSFIRPDLCG